MTLLPESIKLVTTHSSKKKKAKDRQTNTTTSTKGKRTECAECELGTFDRQNP